MKYSVSMPVACLVLMSLILICPVQGDDHSNTNKGTSEPVDLGVASHENAILTPAAGWGVMQFEPPVPGSYQLPPFGQAADGDVLNSANESKKLSDYFGDKFVILSFIYTQCSDLNGCPLVTAVFYKIKQRLAEEDPELAEQLRLISLSFDPVYDTPEVMKFYGQGSQDMGGPEWQFLTTESDQQLQPITEGFGQYVNREYDQEGKPSYRFAHILRVFLIDKKGNKRAQYSAGFLHEESLLSDLKTLLMEERAQILGTHTVN